MNDPQTYGKYIKAHAKKSDTLLCCIKAFVSGGAVCCAGELFSDIFKALGVGVDQASTCVTCALIATAAVLTGIGVFDTIAKHTGAGTLVPVTGFANAMVSQAIDAKSEGFILGVGAKLFTVAGPVVVYGSFASAVYGAVYHICKII